MSFLSTISFLRLQAQQIAGTSFKTPKALVSYLGALQAQDFSMVKWAIGVRMPYVTEKEIENAIDKGDLLRTHLLRPTWHLVSAEDIYWLLELTTPHIKAGQKSRHKQLEITEKVLKKSHRVLEKAFKSNSQLSREELVSELEKANIATNDNRAAHLLFMAELDGILCSGAGHGKNSSYALLSDRVSKPTSLPREEGLAKLTLLYFKSRGPATLHDFVNWSNLPISEAKKGLEQVKSSLANEKSNDQVYYWDKSLDSSSLNNEAVVRLLPAFDEFVIGYKDRSAILSTEHHKVAISNNGIFWPTIVRKGAVIGIWKRALKKDKVVVETHFFTPASKTILKLVEKEVIRYGHFLNLQPEIHF